MNTGADYFRIAGIGLRFDNALRFLPGYEPFRVSIPPNRVQGHFRFTEEDGFDFPALRKGPPRWDSNQWSLHDTEDDRYLMRVRQLPLPHFQAAGLLAQDFSEGVLFPRKTTGNALRSFPFCFPSDEQILLNLLARHQRALIHGCSIDVDGHCLLFCGKSGAGKSSIAKLWRKAGARILNDDRTLLHLSSKGIPQGSASPWHGELPDITPETFPLAGIFRLHQGDSHNLTRLSSCEGFQLLLGNAIAPFYLPDSLEPATKALAAIAERVPCYELTFKLSDDLIPFLRSYAL